MKRINKENIVNWLIKCYYTIIGWYRCKFVFNPKDKDEMIVSNKLNKSNIVLTYKYLGNKTFYNTIQAMETTTGLTYIKSNKVTLKYWEIGILNLQKIT